MRTARSPLPVTAAERRGIQAVVQVTANGASRAELSVGEPVTPQVVAEGPPGRRHGHRGRVGLRRERHLPFFAPEVDGTAARVTLTTTHAYNRPGTYWATCRRTATATSGPPVDASRTWPRLASSSPGSTDGVWQPMSRKEICRIRGSGDGRAPCSVIQDEAARARPVSQRACVTVDVREDLV
jgi:hypothetical protein